MIDMNEQQEKERFFALYWGQSILCSEKWILSNLSIEEVQGWNRGGIKDAYLQLKPLSSITDEDALELGFKQCHDESSLQFGFSPSGVFFDDYVCYGNNLLNNYKIDFLRSRGYALPWLGISVEEQIKRGWIKLIES